MSPSDMARAARAASRSTSGAGAEARSEALRRLAAGLWERRDEVLAANALDVEAAREAVREGGLSAAAAARLALSEGKLRDLARGIRELAEAPDPVGRVIEARELAEGLVLSHRTVPLGVLLVIFEARPDALPQIAALAIRSGNGLLLKGGSEALHSCRALHAVVRDALAALSPDLVALVEGRASVGELLALDQVIDLVIPRGSSELVRHVQRSTRIPVLGHADGICHVYVDRSADPDRAESIALDSKLDYPAACNAMETLLVHREVADTLGRRLVGALEAAGVVVHGADGAFGRPPPPSLSHEYGDLACTVALVDDVHAAVRWIDAHGSHHTDAIVASDPRAVSTFLDGVDSACVFHDASTRFADGYRFGLGAEVGVSTSRIHARGPVGVDGLLTRQWVLEGRGDTVGPFRSGARRFTFRPLR